MRPSLLHAATVSRLIPYDGDPSIETMSQPGSSLKPLGPSEARKSRYSIASASLSSIRRLDATAKKDTEDPTDSLTSKIESLQIGAQHHTSRAACARCGVQEETWQE